MSTTYNNLQLAYPRLCCLFAENPSRLSAAMHNAVFVDLALPFSYVAIQLRDTRIGIQAMRDLGILGASLTIPHKEAAMSLVDDLSPEAQIIGAINTVINDGSRLTGYNTDFIGIREALNRRGVDIRGKKILLLGAGGAARAALFALQSMGQSQIVVSNRTGPRAENLASEFNVESLAWTSLGDKISDFDLVINSSAIGMGGKNVTDFPFALSSLQASQVVFDMVTKETELLQAAASCGAKVIPGIEMLLYQAVEQSRLFTGKLPKVEVMRKALSQIQNEV